MQPIRVNACVGAECPVSPPSEEEDDDPGGSDPPPPLEPNLAVGISNKSTAGSIQRIQFNDSVIARDGISCSKLIGFSANYMGTGYTCELDETNGLLTILYGYNSTFSNTEGTITFEINTVGFLDTFAEGLDLSYHYPTPSLPTFTILSNTITAFQDFSAPMSISIISDGGNHLATWTYISPAGCTQPDISGNRTSFIFNYWEMDPGTYQVSINLTDPHNPNFYFQANSTSWEVQNSCQTNNCDKITWQFTSSPSSCADNCIIGQYTGDTFTMSNSGNSVSATYKSGSFGGMNVTLDPNKYGVNISSCGENLRFPQLQGIITDTSASQSSGLDVNMGVTLDNHEITSSPNNYTLIWTQPEGDYCNQNSPSCTIPRGALTIGSRYIYSIQLYFLCSTPNPSWGELTFTEFVYTGISSTNEIIGSIHILSFGQAVSVSPAVTNNPPTCVDFVVEAGELGTGSVCVLGAQELTIYYGHSPPPGSPTLNLHSTNIIPGVSVSWTRPSFPTFTLTNDSLIDAFKDNYAVVNILYTGTGTMKYEWKYTLNPVGDRPDISLPTNSFTFNYWEMATGTYKIGINMTQSTTGDISNFYYFKETNSFSVEESCAGSCNKITFSFTGEAGTCSVNCVTGYSTINDEISYTSTSNSLVASYEPNSQGGNNLSIIYKPSLHSGVCGENIKFPYTVLERNPPSTPTSGEPHTFSATLHRNDQQDDIYISRWRLESTTETPNCVDNTYSCTIPVGGLTCGVSYTYSLQLFLTCLPPPTTTSVPWSEVIFSTFTYTGILATVLQIIGSTQSITFPYPITQIPGEDPIYLPNISHLGIGYAVILQSPQLFIKYGSNVTYGTPFNITINPAAFSPCIQYNFTRGTIPTFHLDTTNMELEAHQDFIGTMSVTEEVINDGEMTYKWKQILPTAVVLSTNIKAMSFDYLEGIVGEIYQIEVRMTDDNNTNFEYAVESPTYKILNSCSANCDTITWTLTNEPPECEGECLTGAGAEDTFTYEYGKTPMHYEIRAKYVAGSLGGNKMTIDANKYEGLKSSACGGGIKFPKAVLNEDINICKSSLTGIDISGSISANGLAAGVGNQYRIQWVQPEGCTLCKTDRDACRIEEGGGLEAGMDYVFKLQLKMVCQGSLHREVWSEVEFTHFAYYIQAAEPSHNTIGSRQTITFSEPTTLAPGMNSGFEQCSDLLTPDSIPHLGEGYSCTQPTPETLLISYGHLTVEGAQTITLNPLSIRPCFEGSFPRPSLPKFTLQVLGGTLPAYQDNTAQFSVIDIVNMGEAALQFEWKYDEVPGTGSLYPDIGSFSTDTLNYNFTYWTMSPGTYNVTITLLDPPNTHFYYKESYSFTILTGTCTTQCHLVIWKFTNDPSGCESECVSGMEPIDTFDFSTTPPDPYVFTAKYLPHSLGGNVLSIVPAQNNLLQTIHCGGNIKFPSLSLGNDSLDMQATKFDINLSGILNSNGLVLGTDFRLVWFRNETRTVSYCLGEGNISCTIPKHGLVIGEIYNYKVEVNMKCLDVVGWDEVEFTEFEYYPIGIFNESSTITMEDTEIEKKTTYTFKLRPNTTLAKSTIFELRMPTEVKLVGSTCGSIPGRCEVMASSPDTVLRLRDILSTDYLDYTNPVVFIEFRISALFTNPSIPYVFRSLYFYIMTFRADLKIILHEGPVNITGSLSHHFPRYTPHPLDGINIVPHSLITATTTTYKIYFINANYTIPPHSVIHVQFPHDIQLISTPLFTNTVGVQTTITGIFGETCTQCLDVYDGFNSVFGATKGIQFEVGPIINPYTTGETEPFVVNIYLYGDPGRVIFEEISEVRVNILGVAHFPIFGIEIVDEVTSGNVTYTFIVEIGDRELVPGQRISIEKPDEVPQCSISTLAAETGGIDVVGTKEYIPPNNYAFILDQNVGAHTHLNINMSCINPYTTRPTSHPFKIVAVEEETTFYKGIATIPPMSTLNNFGSFTFTLNNIFPRSINQFNLHFLSTAPYPTHHVDLLIIAIAEGMEIVDCTLSEIIGIEGDLECSYTGRIITISGIIQLREEFKFKLLNIRNPELHTSPISFGALTAHSEEFFGENGTSNIISMECDFPCKTCDSDNPKQCTSCYTQNNEVFDNWSLSLHMWYLEESLCLSECPSHTYNKTLTLCRNCDPLCSECVDLNTTCTQCYPNTDRYLHMNNCIPPPCPDGYGQNQINWTCVGNLFDI